MKVFSNMRTTAVVLGVFYLCVSMTLILFRINDACRFQDKDSTALQLPVSGASSPRSDKAEQTEEPRRGEKTLTALSLDAKHKKQHWTDHKTSIDDSCAAAMSHIFRIHDCFRSHDDCSVPGPVHNFAIYGGRGFGSVIQNSVETCMLASVLNRPCVVDLDVRDQYYIWRSFINVGTYNWDPRILAPHQANISDAYSKLEEEQSSFWTEPVPEYDDVLPMFWHKDWKTKERHLEYWHGSNKATAHRVLLSPNWGQAWNKVKIRDYAEKLSGCPANYQRTLIQNAMFTPTSLALSLFKERRDEVMKTKVYGAIHIRMHFLVAKYDKETLSPKNLALALKECLPELGGNVRWWVLSETHDVAVNVTAELGDMAIASYPAQFREDDKHSWWANKEKFGHQLMAPGVQDWMVLHESSVAVTTYGTYASTGARGNGKVIVGHCGSAGKVKQPMFEFYQKPPEAP